MKQNNSKPHKRTMSKEDVEAEVGSSFRRNFKTLTFSGMLNQHFSGIEPISEMGFQLGTGYVGIPGTYKFEGWAELQQEFEEGISKSEKVSLSGEVKVESNEDGEPKVTFDCPINLKKRDY